MEAIKLYRRKGINRSTRFLIAVLIITIIACGISFNESSASQKEVKKVWKSVFGGFASTISLEVVEHYSPSLRYGVYAMMGKAKFPNWELGLLNESLGKKYNTTLQLVQELSKEAENENVKEASVLDQTLIIDRALEENNESAEVGIIHGENYFEQEYSAENAKGMLLMNKKKIDTLKSTKSLNYLLSNFYIVDSSTSISKSVFNVEKLLKKECIMKKNEEKPQILIYHTHGGSESFIDSDGTKKDSIVGAGGLLAEILTEEYGYNVIHDETSYDIIGGKIDRSKAYNKALKGIKKTLQKHPSIEVIIDLHRDGANTNPKRITEINGKKTAQIMLFNGLSRKASGQNIAHLKNPRLQDNLAFSLKMEMKAMELYPDFVRKIFLKNYRYNLHLRDKSLLIELGSNYNTVAEARNAMEPLAEVLNQVLNEE